MHLFSNLLKRGLALEIGFYVFDSLGSGNKTMIQLVQSRKEKAKQVIGWVYDETYKKCLRRNEGKRKKGPYSATFQKLLLTLREYCVQYNPPEYILKERPFDPFGSEKKICIHKNGSIHLPRRS